MPQKTVAVSNSQWTSTDFLTCPQFWSDPSGADERTSRFSRNRDCNAAFLWTNRYDRSQMAPGVQCMMNLKQLLIWFSTVSTILVIVGVVFAFFGLKILPVERTTLLPWQSAIYGAIMMGWGTTLWRVGRIAFRRNDSELLKALILGLAVWLVVEAAFSIYFAVWFNVGVDIAVLALFSVPLLKAIALMKKQSSSSSSGRG